MKIIHDDLMELFVFVLLIFIGGCGIYAIIHHNEDKEIDARVNYWYHVMDLQDTCLQHAKVLIEDNPNDSTAKAEYERLSAEIYSLYNDSY